MKKGKIGILVFLLTLMGCGKTPIQYQYGVKEMYEKIWDEKINVIHNETCLMIEDENNEKSARLLFTPTRIISVRDYTLQKEYSPNEYEIRGDRIYMTENSSIPYLTQDNIQCKVLPESIRQTYPSSKVESGNILFTEGAGIVMNQIAVTYEKEEKWEGAIPKKYGEKFTNTYQKLSAGEPITIVAYGASTMTGCNASSILGIEPFQETFVEGFVNSLKAKYSSEITLINTAIGGTTSVWGRENVEARVQNYHPDLVLLEFGHNDACWNIKVDDYIDNMDFLIRACRAYDKDTDVIMVSSHMANPNSDQYTFQTDYLKPLRDLADQYEGVGICDWTTLTLDIQKKKSSFDMYANNINHPADWLERVFATALIESFEK